MAQTKTIIFCEGSSDERIIRMVLAATGQGIDADIVVLECPLSPWALLAKLPEDDANKKGGSFGRMRRISRDYDRAIIVFDLEFGGPNQWAPELAQLDGMLLCPAVPTVDTWILSDPIVFSNLYQDLGSGDFSSFDQFVGGRDIHFINAKQKRRLTSKSVSGLYSPARAAAVSPSLRNFLQTVHIQKAFEPQIKLPSIIMSALVSEFYPSDAPIYKTLEGAVLTGAEMAKEIQNGTDVGKVYASELLRVSRDLLSRQALKHKDR